jgi:hypothetical protein
MKRLDLIISAIEDALKDFKTDSYDNDFHGCCGADVDFGHTADCKLTQALAAARELREMECVAWMWKDGTITTDPDRADGTWTPIYALGDEK